MIVTKHGQITGLSVYTDHIVVVSVTDATGNGPVLKNATFTTAASADTTPPVILEGATVSASTADGMVVDRTTSQRKRPTTSL